MTPMRMIRKFRRPRAAPLRDDEFHDLQIALGQLARDETPNAVNTLVRDACYDAADEADLERARRLIAITKGQRRGSQIGEKLACEILAALGRFLEESENGRERA